MARVIEGDIATFNALIYGAPHPNTQQFLYNQYQNPTTVLTAAGQQFIDYGRQIHQQLAESRTVQYVTAVQRAVGAFWQVDAIRPLVSVAECQWAPPTMQRYIMAHPKIRQLYHDQRIEGFQGTYVDLWPEDTGPAHYDYRRLKNGVVEWDDDNHWTATTFFDELAPGDRELSTFEQDALETTTLSILTHFRAGKDDPTSRWNSSL